MGTITKAVAAINLDVLKGTVFTPAYKPVEIVEKNVEIAITTNGFGNEEFIYTFTKDRNKHQRALSVPSGSADGDSMTVVLGECDDEVNGTAPNGKPYSIEVGDQKLMLRPVDFKLDK